MANKTPVKAIFTGSDVTALGEFVSGDTILASLINGVPTGSLALAGGAMTGAITTNSTFDGVDIATRDAILTSTTTTASAALPKAGGTMTGDIAMGANEINTNNNINLADNGKARFGTGNDLQIYHDGSNSYVQDAGTGNLILKGTVEIDSAGGSAMATFVPDGAVTLYHANAAKLATSAAGVTVTGVVAATTLTGDGSGLTNLPAGGATALDGLSDAKSAGTNFTGSLILGHQTTGTLDAAGYNTAVGLTAMDAITSGDANNCLGYNSLGAITTGSSNTAIGKNAMKLNTTGGNNIAIGQDAFWSNTTFDQNIAIGNNCMAYQDAGIRNTVIGNYAFDASTGGSYNTIMGYSAATKATSTGCRNNTIIGTHAADDLDAGWQNTIIGYWAADGQTSGFKNTIIGGEAGNVTTGNYNICIGNVADVPTPTSSGQINIGNAFKMLSNGNIQLRPNGEVQNTVEYQPNRTWNMWLDPNNWGIMMWDGASTSTNYFLGFRIANNTQIGHIGGNSSNVTYNTSSDYRLKENLDYTWDATTRLKQLKPVRFNWISDETNTLQDGFIAHEVEDIVPVAITGEKDAMEAEVLYKEGDAGTETTYYKRSDQDVIDGIKEAGDVKVAPTNIIGDVRYAEVIKPQVIDPSKMVSLLVKTVQELEARITTLENA